MHSTTPHTMNSTVATALESMTASQLFDGFETSDEWAGFGYINERCIARLNPDNVVEETDRFVAQHAASEAWTVAELFVWANSKLGRWAGDVVFGGAGAPGYRMQELVRRNLISRVDAGAVA